MTPRGPSERARSGVSVKAIIKSGSGPRRAHRRRGEKGETMTNRRMKGNTPTGFSKIIEAKAAAPPTGRATRKEAAALDTQKERRQRALPQGAPITVAGDADFQAA